MKKFRYLLAVLGLVAGTLFTASLMTRFGVNPIPALVAGFFVVIITEVVKFQMRKQGASLMAISYTSPTTITGDVYAEVMNEVLYQNNTIGRKLVRFIRDVKANVPIRTLAVTVADQAYSSGAPSSSGTLTPGDKLITPVKRMFYQEFDYETLRGTAHGTNMKSGAFNIIDDEFARNVIALIGPKQALAIESRFWNGATSATQTAVAALTPGTNQNEVSAAEQAYVASLTAGPVDGILTKLIYNTGAVGSRYKVAGTTLSGSNIKTEIDKVYVRISPKLLQAGNIDQVTIFMPYSCKQFIEIYNNTATNFKDLFVRNADGTYKYAGIQIEFVPIPDNTMIAGIAMDIVWCTDLLDDVNTINVDKIANNREDYFLKTIYTMESWIFNQSEKVVYVG